ncbi:hypothetical protein ACFV9C_32130 [Kribbella sp. NPDC059898]|uniref:hypothetical protein n=1 Tax=Kribbella sp. NPDC059898 TaxID=3346995 RepID=UPI00364B8D46
MSGDQEQQTNPRPWWRFWQSRSGGGASAGSRVSAVYAVEVTAIAGGLVATIVYAAAGSKASLPVVSASVMIAVAALGSGVLVGILFGVPRTTTGNDRPAGGDAAIPATGAVGANTNLEQISDWLTKILVGVGLTQFVAIKREAGQLFHALAPALGNGNGRESFAGSVVIYFFVVGFLSGWLYARLRLGLLMSNTDALLELARRADRAGDTETAQTARERANNQLALATDASPGRQARRLTDAQAFAAPDVAQLFNEGTPASRMAALALMETDLQLADFPSVLNAIQSPRSTSEQYHALTVANLMAAALAPDDKTRLHQALESDDVRSQWEGDTSRADLAATILTTLASATG